MNGAALQAAIGRLEPALPDFTPGHVWLAGAGPGSAGCLTLEVVAALGAADAVVYDALVDPAVLRAADGAALHYVGKRRGAHSKPQAEINTLLITLAQEGARVLRLKGGDPNIFGRGGEEALALAQAGVPFRILPGVTSAFGALADARIPATRRGVSKALILATGHGAGTEDDLDLRRWRGPGSRSSSTWVWVEQQRSRRPCRRVALLPRRRRPSSRPRPCPASGSS